MGTVKSSVKRGPKPRPPIERSVLALRDDNIYKEVMAREKQDKEQLRAINGNWEDVIDFIEELT